MTQMPPPPGAPGPVPPVGYPAPPLCAKPWSASAIAGFVLSLVGCLGITALLGLVFGIVGIVRTSGGQRRGLGLAIAAIPISLIMAFVSLMAFGAIALFVGAGPRIEQIRVSLESSDPAATAAAVRTVCSDSFNARVDDATLLAWFDQVRKTHGKLVELERPTQAPQRSDKAVTITLDGKFVNGRAPVTIKIMQEGFLKFTVDDFAVDGVSPRQLATDDPPEESSTAD